MIYLFLIFFYSIWITINCDNWSAKLFNIYDLKYKGEDEEDEEESNENEEEINEENGEENDDEEKEDEECD